MATDESSASAQAFETANKTAVAEVKKEEKPVNATVTAAVQATPVANTTAAV